MDIEIQNEDVVKNLFNDKYSKEVILDVLSKLESKNELIFLIKKYHPKYYIESSKFTPEKVATITLAKDLGYW